MNPSSAASDPAAAPSAGARPPRGRRRAALAAVLAFSALGSACGGGLWLTVPVGDPSDEPLRISLSPLPPVVQPGGLLTLGAGVSGPYAIEQVAFYRIDGRVSTFIGRDETPPFQTSTFIPGDGRSRVAYFAQVSDVAGRVTPSQVVEAVVVY